MRNRAVVSALIFIVLCTSKIFFPANAAKVRDAVMPAITREADIREDCVAIGRAVSGENSYIGVWERLTGREEQASPSEDTAEASARADASGEFVLSDMVSRNLIGYEALAGLPERESQAQESAAEQDKAETGDTESTDATGADTAETGDDNSGDKETEPVPSVDAADVSAPVPIAPEPLPADNTEAVSGQEAKIEEFLEEQAAFSDYAIPANVSYDAPVIPFEYSDPVDCPVTSAFGYRVHPIDGNVKFHYGVDLGAPDGTDITAFADGTVLSVQELDGYGSTVLIEHADGFETLYAHCGHILVEQGQTVCCGESIALSGHSGDVTGPHLHFEIIYNGKYLNPEFYL